MHNLIGYINRHCFAWSWRELWTFVINDLVLNHILNLSSYKLLVLNIIDSFKNRSKFTYGTKTYVYPLLFNKIDY